MININRHNYEEYFLLYTDDELDVAEKHAVEEFVQQNPDLAIELEMLRQSTLRPDPIVFHHKDALLKSSFSIINETNYEEYFVLYADDELTDEEKDSVEQFVYTHPKYRADFDLMQAARLHPDVHVQFPDKTILYRTEEDDKVIVFRWWKVVAAAVLILFFSGLGWYFLSSRKPADIAVKDKPAQKSQPSTPEVQQPVPERSQQESLVTVTAKSNELKPAGKDHPGRVEITPVEKRELAQTLENSENEENLNTGRNIQIASNVIAEKPEVNVQKIESSTSVAMQVTPHIVDEPVGVVEENPYAYTASDNEIEILNTSISKKTRLRGLLRKVSRVVEKTTNIEPDGRGIRIANFELGLK